MRFILTFLLFFVVFGVYSQNRQMVSGKVVSRSKKLEDIYVSNLSTGDATMTSKGGYFYIKAQPKDTLMFAGAYFIGYRHILDEVDMKRDMFLIPLEPNEMTTQLDEIIIRKFSAIDMGLIPRNTRMYTPMEKQLYTATSGGGIIPVSAIINLISGRTAMLKKALKYEKQEMRKDAYLSIVSENRLFSDYGIPSDYAVGFAYYVANDSQMMPLLNSTYRNKDQIESRTKELALEFIELLQEKATKHEEKVRQQDKNKKPE
ncbi:MAG: hypothetical protein LBI72_11055 [Flavobacteriaceae bacterium]|jgi:hypothetical protein|nr:hypothetical protein [Flavobacteriaceae bacterium]